MSLKTKLTRLEKRLGVERCPHCGGLLPMHREDESDDESMSNEEIEESLCRSLVAMCGRDEMLALLAYLQSPQGPYVHRQESTAVETMDQGALFLSRGLLTVGDDDARAPRVCASPARGLRGVSPAGVQRGKSPAQVVEPVAVTGRRVRVLLRAGQLDSRLVLKRGQFVVQLPFAVGPREHER